MNYQQTIEQRFATRVERLHRLYELKAPPKVICAEIVLLFKAAVLLYGPVFWERMHAGLEQAFRNSVGFCGE